MSNFDIETFTTGYIDCILWADAIPRDAESDPDNFETGGLTHLIVSDKTRATIAERAMLADFIEANADDLALYCEAMGPWIGTDDRGYVEEGPEARAGHDFYLTRSGHGTGFWDRGLGELGDRLSEASNSYGSADDHMIFEDSDGIHAVL